MLTKMIDQKKGKTLLMLSFFGLLNFTSVQANSLVFCTEAAPEGFDPTLTDSGSTNNVTRQIYQGLVQFKPGTTEIEPSLAERFEVSEDGLRYTFYLRKGVAFHKTPYFEPSRELNADDVVFTFGRYLDKDVPYNKDYFPVYLLAENMGFAKAVQSVNKIDDYTVEFELYKPNVPFLSSMAMTLGFILSKEYADQLLAENNMTQLNQKPIGTGPFVFRHYSKDSMVRFGAHENYWGKPQKLKNLVFNIVTDPNVRIQNLKRNECQISANIPENIIETLEKEPNIRIESVGAMNISYLSYNLKRPFLAKKEVRKALDMAIDRDALFQALFPKGGATQAINPYPEGILGWNKDNKNEYDPEKAKQLLVEAGYPEGFKLNLWYLPVQRPTNPNGKLMAQMIQADWKKIGVETEIMTYEWAEYLKRAGDGEHDVYMSGWTSDSGDPDDFLYGSLSCDVSKNKTRFCNEAFDQALVLGRQTLDPEKRAEIYSDALKVFKEERPWITIAHSKIYIPMNKKVNGFVMRPNGAFYFEDVSYER